ncbi:MAG TPA: polyprenol monophosphomannose synthase [Cyclobacteriaceae bacterium]|nr:polyprenol monophosphomannose synthase [Cyclobacteriaceae bacterium]
MSNALVIIPTYNEKENIVQIINAVIAQPKDFDLLIIDDNSPDGTAELVKQQQARYNTDSETKLHLIQRAGKLGLGTAYIEGFRFAISKGYDYILEMDADFSHDPRDLQRLYFACSEDGFDLSVGSRYSKGVNVVNWSMKRVLMSYFASRYVRIITGIPLHDTTAGFVCYKKPVLEKIPLERIKFVGYAFQIEMKFLAWKYGFKITEVPIVFTDRTLGESKMSVGIFKEGFLGVLQMTVRSWFRSFK